MHGKKIRLGVVGFITVAAIIFFATTLRGAFVSAGDTDINNIPPSYVAPLSTSTNAIHYDVPSRLSIPALSIDAHVQQVGLTKKNTMGIPTNFTDVAWYQFGPKPGEVGSAVIDGHVDNGLALAGVFKHLKEIKVGDDIYITDASGTKIHFKVSRIDLYPYTDAPADDIFNEKSRTLLRLITCQGDWIKADKTYDKRLVVTAEVQP